MEETKAVLYRLCEAHAFTARTPSPSTTRCKINHSKTLIQLNKIYFNLNRLQWLPLLLVLLLSAQHNFRTYRLPCRHVLVFIWNLIYIFWFLFRSVKWWKINTKKKRIHFFSVFLRASFLRNTKFISCLYVCLCVCVWMSKWLSAFDSIAIVGRRLRDNAIAILCIIFMV